MEFRTPLTVSPSDLKIDHQKKILTLGSCFANVIGEKLESNKFQVKVNPFGVLFNPLSLFTLINSLTHDKNPFEGAYIEHQGVWYNYHLHSDFSAGSENELKQKISDAIHELSEYIRRTNILTITFGTSFIYRLLVSNEVVANCHKVPSTHFTKELINPALITDGFANMYAQLKKVNPSIRIILTVSPVRHIKDGIEQNSISKSILRYACQLIQEKFPDTGYFPSFEIMMDDLRDYRFYKEDMIHPTEVAENYIWEKFTLKYIDPSSIDTMKEWQALSRAIAHKAFHPDSEAHQKFLKETLDKLKKLSTLIDVKKELEELNQRIRKS